MLSKTTQRYTSLLYSFNICILGNTIAFLVKKAAQFDVPFFQFIALQPAGSWNWVVIYLEDPNQQSQDIELGASSQWGIDLTNNYRWEFIGNSPTNEAIQLLYQRLQITLLITNGYKFGYSSYLTVARLMHIPMALRIDSVLTGKNGASLLLRKYFMQWTYRHFNAFFTTGKMGYAYLKYVGIPASKQFWFPYCTHNHFFAQGLLQYDAINATLQNYGVATDKPIVLGVCKFITRENPADLLDAFILLNNAHVQLVMIGDGDQAAALQSRAAQFPHLPIYFPGYVAYTQLPSWYASAHVFVHPAQDEPWGVSLQEAMAAGCGVVASNKVGSAYDFVIPGKNGFMYTVNRPTELAACLQKILLISKKQIAETNQTIWQKWNYSSVWEHIQEAATTIVRSTVG
jgi:glycosyltransferase involved in cell wall biosynthesis